MFSSGQGWGDREGLLAFEMGPGMYRERGDPGMRVVGGRKAENLHLAA